MIMHVRTFIILCCLSCQLSAFSVSFAHDFTWWCMYVGFLFFSSSLHLFLFLFCFSLLKQWKLSLGLPQQNFSYNITWINVINIYRTKIIKFKYCLVWRIWYEFFYKLKNIEKLSKLSHFKVSFTILPFFRKLC